MALCDRVVLIGDPDHVTSALYQRTLRASFDVIVAADEETALQILQSSKIDVFVLELTLIREHDWERLSYVGQLCAARGTQLVICSTLDERRRGFEIGAVAYLIKPTLPSQLMHTIQSVFDTNLPGAQ